MSIICLIYLISRSTLPIRRCRWCSCIFVRVEWALCIYRDIVKSFLQSKNFSLLHVPRYCKKEVSFFRRFDLSLKSLWWSRSFETLPPRAVSVVSHGDFEYVVTLKYEASFRCTSTRYPLAWAAFASKLKVLWLKPWFGSMDCYSGNNRRALDGTVQGLGSYESSLKLLLFKLVRLIVLACFSEMFSWGCKLVIILPWRFTKFFNLFVSSNKLSTFPKN